jgi:hypothetical protein
MSSSSLPLLLAGRTPKFVELRDNPSVDFAAKCGRSPVFGAESVFEIFR